MGTLVLSPAVVELMEAENPPRSEEDLVVANQNPGGLFGSISSLRAAQRRHAGTICWSNWGCNRCGNILGAGSDYFTSHPTCPAEPRGYYCVLAGAGVDPLIRGYCSDCNRTGQFGRTHLCPTLENSGREVVYD